MDGAQPEKELLDVAHDKDVTDVKKENETYTSVSGDITVQDPVPINTFPDDETDGQAEENAIFEAEHEKPSFDESTAKSKVIDWAKNDDGSINKKMLMRHFLDTDGGSGQSGDSYRFLVSAIKDGDTEPSYCPLAIDNSWNLASGKLTGIANRTVMKKIVFLKEREGIPLNEEQMEFTQRHMSALIDDNAEIKLNESILEDANEMGGLVVIDNNNIKMNAALSGSKVIYEDNDVIDVPVIPMREGVFTGTDGIPTLKKFEHFGNDAHWLEGQPILKGHTGPTELVTYRHNRIGKLMNVTARPDKKDVVAVARYYKNKLSPEDLTRIKSDVPYDGSIAYTTHTSMTDGDYNGSKYNAIEDGGYHFYHFAELANGKGACSHEEGCGFLLNEAPKKSGDTILKVYKNNLRSASVIERDLDFIVKLNSGLVYEAKDNQDAETFARDYVQTGMKLNYNCPDSEKSGSGKGSCGGSDKADKAKERLSTAKEEYFKNHPEVPRSDNKPQVAIVKEGPEKAMTIVGGPKKTPEEDKALEDQMATFKDSGGNKPMEVVSGPKTDVLSAEPEVGQSKRIGIIDKNNIVHATPGSENIAKLFIKGGKDGSLAEMREKYELVGKHAEPFDGNVWKEKSTGQHFLIHAESANKHLGQKIHYVSKIKHNSYLSNSNTFKGNNMTDNIETETMEIEPMENIVQKLNESFDAKLNAALEAKDTEITSLREMVNDLVQKQNAAEQAIAESKAQEDFAAFTQKLNKAHQKDAQVHYDGFKAEGWKYITTHPEAFKVDIPKMNARGVPEAGENISELAKARAELQKTLAMPHKR